VNLSLSNNNIHAIKNGPVSCSLIATHLLSHQITFIIERKGYIFKELFKKCVVARFILITVDLLLLGNELLYMQ